jgi:hypothetical protein
MGSPAPTFVSNKKKLYLLDKCLSFYIVIEADKRILLQVTTATLCLKNARMFQKHFRLQ